jgi:hypothetical protein
MFGLIRAAVIALSFSLGVAFVGLMVRSYSWCDSVVYEPQHGTSYLVRSIDGSFLIRRTFSVFGCINATWRGSSTYLPTMQLLDEYRKQNASPSHLGGQSSDVYSSYWVDIPHWLAAIMATLPGVITFRVRTNQFSLRTAMLVTTAVALILGLVATL